MKRLSFALVVFACISAAFGATRQDTVARSTTAPARVSRAPQTDTNTDANKAPTTRTVTSRSATTQSTPSVARGRAATTPTTNARAAKQSVISTGTKVATATENTAVDQVCWAKFSGCMDSFCMLDNANGGRCICSDKNAEYDAILQEIQNLDDQSYQLATVGVERIEMGDAVDEVMSKTDSVTKRVTADAAKSKRQSLDLSSWNSLDLDFDADAEDIFDFSSDGVSIANKTGDALYRAAAKLCNAQIPECKSQSTLMDLMYKQRVRSDCTAYENSLRAARTQSAQKLYAAQSAMREAALEQYRNANKYDLGQCTVQFKQCMQTTGGCGDDFTGCVDLAARANSEAKKSEGKKAKQKTIKGTSSKIQISAETYDTLEAKKALCMTVTQQCVNVRDQVWDAFLREAAPQIKSAELIVESNLRTSCISNISNCFQKACHDTMDPNDPEGSYDMCLTRPDTLRSVCKVEIDPCEAAEPTIMNYVRARLKSMRVDSCTNEFKACLQSEDRCGEDYTQCIGLNTDTIVSMCPPEKLTGCTYEYDGTKTDDNLKEIAQGIFLNIDNNLLAACQKAVQKKVIEVCGSLSECQAFDDDTVIGTDSLMPYKDENGDTVIDGLINFGLLTFDDNYLSGNTKQPRFHHTSMDAYINGVTETSTQSRLKSAYLNVENKAQQKVNVLRTDPTVKTCVEGRGDKWRGGTADTRNGGFPNILDSYVRMIFNSALDKATENYRAKYDELVADALRGQSEDEKRMICTMLGYDKDSVTCRTEDDQTICETVEPIGSLFEGLYNNKVGGLTNGGASYVIDNADLAKKLELMSHNSSQIVVLNEKYGYMISLVTKQAFYSGGTCTITTTTTECAKEQDITHLAESDYVKEKKYEDGTIKKYVCDDCKEKFDGVMCGEYAAPIEKVIEIQM